MPPDHFVCLIIEWGTFNLIFAFTFFIFNLTAIMDGWASRVANVH